MLYLFAGFPRSGLHAGGLTLAIEQVECLGELVHDPAIQYRKTGVYLVTHSGEEWVRDVEHQLSPRLIDDGITWDWFPENHWFGNGVTMHQTMASPSNSKSWEDYQARWTGNKCPEETHIVNITEVVTREKLGPRAYARLTELVEAPTGKLAGIELYDRVRGSGKHFSTVRPYSGEPAMGRR